MSLTSFADDTEVLTRQNNRSLSGRVHRLLLYRLQGLNSCSPVIKDYYSKRFTEIPPYSENERDVLRIIALYLDSRQRTGPCGQALNSAEALLQKEERRPFSFLHSQLDLVCKKSPTRPLETQTRSCSQAWDQMLSDLDFNCVSTNVPALDGRVDPFQCMAGDQMIGKQLIAGKQIDTFLQESQQFIENFRIALDSPQRMKQGVDLWLAYPTQRPSSAAVRERFLAYMNFFLSSYHSASGVIRGFHDQIWRAVLAKTLSAEKTLRYFQQARLRVDEFRTLYTWALEQKIPLFIRGIDIGNFNRHDYMAAYLSCHYREKDLMMRKALPLLLGYGYESIDFVTHLTSDGYSFKAAKENFITDTKRYSNGVAWGYQFCKEL